MNSKTNILTQNNNQPFDYTEWQKGLWKHETVEGLSRQAMKYVSTKHSEDGTK